MGFSFLIPTKFITSGWINNYHPNCIANLAVRISSEDLLSAFSKKMSYYRKDRQAFDSSSREPASSIKRKKPLASDSEDEERQDLH